MYIHVHNPTFVHRGICLIFFFVTGFGTLPPYHGVALRTKESGGLRREAEAGPFAVHRDASFSLLPRQGVTESHVIVLTRKVICTFFPSPLTNEQSNSFAR